MQVKAIFSFLLFAWFGFLPAQAAFNRSSFYTVMMSDNLGEIDKELAGLDKLKTKTAFAGALLMKKSGLISSAKDRLHFFREGRKALEMAITADSTNTEYRFLRLLVQENAPKMLNYTTEIKKDASYLRQHYKDLPTGAQKAVLNYSNHSKELKPEDFKTEVHD